MLNQNSIPLDQVSEIEHNRLTTETAGKVMDVKHHIGKLANDTFAALEKIAADERYTGDHKSELIAQERDSALESIDFHYDLTAKKIEKEIDELEPFVQPKLTPSDADAPKLQYTRDMLTAQWSIRDEPLSLLIDWQRVIDSGDSIAARVYRDFLPAFIKQNQKHYTPGNRESALVQATDELLMTPKQKAASKRLNVLRESQVELKREYVGVKARLQGAAYQRGQVMTGLERDIQRITRM